MNDKSGVIFTRSFSVLTIGAIGALIVLVILGSWQVQRLFWKEALIAQVNSKVQQAPVPLASIMDQALDPDVVHADLEYTPTQVRGTFDHEVELFYYATLDGKIGWHVYSPFEVSGGEQQVLLINRGFVPDDKKGRADRPDSITKGEQVVRGLFRWPDFQKPNRFTPDNDEKNGDYFWRDHASMVTAAGPDQKIVLPFFIYAERKQDDQLPVGGVSIIEFPNNHLGYAVTWFGLALTLIGVYAALLIGRLQARKTISA